MKRFLATFTCLALATAVVAACGGDDEGGGGANTASAPATTTPRGGAQAGRATTTVGMRDIEFMPQSITAKVGQTVRWVNNEPIEHNVTATSGAQFKSPNFGAGGTYRYRLARAGTIKYVCTLHPGMDGTITVTR